MTMPIGKLIAPAVDWSDETWASRLDRAASLLYCHGYITQAQRSKITQRIEKQCENALAKGEIIARAPEVQP